jgi:hypothetical protein
MRSYRVAITGASIDDSVDVQAPLGRLFIDIPKAQGESGAQPDRVTDNFGLEPGSFEGDSLHQHSATNVPPLRQLS